MSVYPSERRVLVRGGILEAEIAEAGEGAPLLYLHGEWDRPWDDFRTSLASTRKIIAPRHPGFDGSSGNEHLQDVPDLTYYYLDFLDALDLRNLPLIGHGLGGMVAAELAAMQPERFTRLILIAPLGLWNSAYPVLDYFAAEPADLARALYHDTGSPAAIEAITVPTEDQAYIRFMLDRAKSLATAAKYLWPIPNRGLRKRLHRVRMPTMLVWGESDGVCPPRYADDFRLLLPDSRIELIPEAGHMAQVDQPARLADLVERFLGKT